MGWSIGYDNDWQRDIGYGVPAYCDHPGCNEKIDRGLAYVCGGEPWGQPHGCGLYFCSKHLWYKRVESGEFVQACARCKADKEPFEASPDHPEWIAFKLNDDSWEKWRDENPDIERQMQTTLDGIPKRVVAAAIKKALAEATTT